MRKITEKWLKKNGVSWSDYDVFKNWNLVNLYLDNVVEKLIELKKFDMANWLFARSLTKADRLKYAVNAAELVLTLFEKEYPGDDRPRKAIHYTKMWIESIDNINKLKIKACNAYNANTVEYYNDSSFIQTSTDVRIARRSLGFHEENAFRAANLARNTANDIYHKSVKDWTRCPEYFVAQSCEYAAGNAPYSAVKSACKAVYNNASSWTTVPVPESIYAGKLAEKNAMEKILQFGLELIRKKGQPPAAYRSGASCSFKIKNFLRRR